MCFNVKVNIRKTCTPPRLPWAKTCKLLTTEHKDPCDALDLLQDHSNSIPRRISPIRKTLKDGSEYFGLGGNSTSVANAGQRHDSNLVLSLNPFWLNGPFRYKSK